MARKVKTITIDTEGRDNGKSYLLTEMDVHRAEKWAMRALLALAASGADVDPTSGVAGLGDIGESLAHLKWDDAEPLLDEMMTCVQFTSSLGIIRALHEGDIEEVKTLFTLRKEILGLHFDFFVAAGG